MTSWMTEEELERLNEPFPDEAYKKLTHGAKLTTLKAAYVTERLHYTFGQGNVEIVKDVVHLSGDLYRCSGVLNVYSTKVAGQIRRCIPFCGVTRIDEKARDVEDHVKGVFTDAIKKALNENLWLAGPLFKGLIGFDSSGNVKMVDEDRSATTDTGAPTGYDASAVAVKLAKAELASFYKKRGEKETKKLVGDWAVSLGMETPAFSELTDEDKVSLAAFLKTRKDV